MEGGGTPRLDAAFLRSPYWVAVPAGAADPDRGGARAGGRRRRAHLRRGGAGHRPHGGADGPRDGGAMEQ